MESGVLEENCVRREDEAVAHKEKTEKSFLLIAEVITLGADAPDSSWPSGGARRWAMTFQF